MQDKFVTGMHKGPVLDKLCGEDLSHTLTLGAVVDIAIREAARNAEGEAAMNGQVRKILWLRQIHAVLNSYESKSISQEHGLVNMSKLLRIVQKRSHKLTETFANVVEESTSQCL